MGDTSDTETSAVSGVDSRGRPGGTSAPDPLRWWALAVLMMASFMDLLDNTIVNVALPTIQHSLNSSYAGIQWIVAAYTMAFAVVLIPGGRLGDIYGRKKLFFIGILVFVGASIMCGFSQSPGMLIGSRALEGAAAAVMVPQVLGIIRATFPEREMPIALAIFGPTMGLAVVGGPILSGVLLHANILNLGWRTIFLINVPIGLLAVAAAIPLVRPSRGAASLRLDLIGVALLTIALLLLVYPIVQGRELGWPLWTFISIGLSLPALVVFALYERRTDRAHRSPLVVVALFRRRTFTAGLLVCLTFFCGMTGFFLIYTFYLQYGIGYSPLHAGLSFVPTAIGAAIGSGISAPLAAKAGRVVVNAGSLLTAACIAWLVWVIHHYGAGIGTWNLAWPVFVAGIGMGLVLAPLFTIILSDVDNAHAGSASGILNGVQQLGNALAAAIIATIFFGLLASHAVSSSTSVLSPTRAALASAGVSPSGQDRIATALSACTKARAKEKDPSVNPPSCADLGRVIVGVSGSPAQRGQVQAIIGRAGDTVHHNDFIVTMEKTCWVEVGILSVTFLLGWLLPGKRATRPADATMPA